MPITETYRQLLQDLVTSVGSQAMVAKKVGVDQTTISRTLEPGSRASYTTLMKLKDAYPSLPSPVVEVRDRKHEQWCRLGAQLAGGNPELFTNLLNVARQAVEATPVVARVNPEKLDHLHAVTANPLPGSSGRKR